MKHILYFFLLFATTAWTQPRGTGQFVNYTVKDGLCESFCTGIAQDSRGFYWISTQGGINRFDGTNFKAYFPSEMLSEKQYFDNSRVFFESTPNQLIVTLGNSEAHLLNCISQELLPIPSLKDKHILDFIRIDKDRIAAPSLDTVFILNNQLKLLHVIVPPLKGKRIPIQMKMLSASTCLLICSKEYFVYNFKTNRFQPFNTRLPTDGLAHSGYHLLYVDTERQWIYMANFFKGLFQLDYSGEVLYSWSEQKTNDQLPGLPSIIIPDPDDSRKVWTSGNLGLAHLDVFTRKSTRYLHDPLIPFSLGNDQVNYLFPDRYHNLCVASANGISLLNKNSTLIDYWTLPISSDEALMSLCRISDHELLTPKYFDGVFKINESNRTTEVFNGQKLKGSWFVFKDGTQIIQGGEGTTVKQVDLLSNRVKELTFLNDYFKESELVVLGLRHSSGDWWFSGNLGGGLVRINPKTGKSVHFSKDKKSFSASYLTHYSETPNGDLWFSSNKAQLLLHWIKAEDRFEEINFESLLERQHQSVIQCITTDHNGNVWVGFGGGGLVRYDVSSKKLLSFDKKDGIPSNFICNLVFDSQNRLWIGTQKGMACISANLKKVQSFGVENGFPSERFDQMSYFDKQTGMIWTSCDQYLLRFYPDKLLKEEQQHLEIFIDEFLVSNRKQPIGEQMLYSFSPTQNTIQLSFASLNSLGKSRIEYSYWLEGAFEHWVSLGTNSSVDFPSLGSGKYVFHLRAKIQGTKNWVYLKEPVHFLIGTPWYRSWWFKVVVFIAAAGLIFFITRLYFSRKIEKQRAVLEKQKAIQDERDRIAYDMHDDLGSGLTRISYLSKEAIKKQDNQQELERINAASLELVENMSELIWAMKMENDTLTDLLAYLRHYAMEYLETNRINVHIAIDDVETDVIISGESRRHVFLIFKEALHNIVKHAETEKAEIAIGVTEEYLQIRIRDFGKGVREEAESKKFRNGMKTMQKRVQQLNGSMELVNADPGVQLNFEFPLR